MAELVSAYVHKIVKRNACVADVEKIRREWIGRTIAEQVEDDAKSVPVLSGVRLQIMDAYLDDLRRLVLVLRPVGSW